MFTTLVTASRTVVSIGSYADRDLSVKRLDLVNEGFGRRTDSQTLKECFSKDLKEEKGHRV